MSIHDTESSDGVLPVDQEPVDPFTKILFNPHEGIMSLAPIRPGILKEIGTVTKGPGDIEKVAR